MNTFNFHENITEVVLVGCGGTGSGWARIICRIVYDLRRRRQHVPSIRFIDPDRVEERNVGRQMFTGADVGHFKAEVLARRFNLALGLGILWHNEPFDAERHISRYGTLVCGAVDNYLARREMSKARTLWIDSGNHTNSGQVVIGNSGDIDRISYSLRSGDYSQLPNAALLFPSLLEPDPAPTPSPAASCAELVERAEQSLVINDMMSIVAGQYTYQVLNHLPVTTFISYVSSAPPAVRSVPVCNLEIVAMLTDRS